MKKTKKERERAPFQASQFVATKWATAEDKAKFANELAAFVVGGCKPESFTEKLYKPLNYMFGHIAHYDRQGFIETWFATERARYAWVRNAVEHVAYGDPTFTWSDVGRAFTYWLRDREELARFQRMSEDVVQKRELEELARLKAKYERSKS